MTTADRVDARTIGLLPRIGYNFPLGSKASIWPRIAAGYYDTSYSRAAGYPSTTGYTFTFRAFVPFLFHPVPHFFIGGGPMFSTDLVSKYEDVDSSDVQPVRHADDDRRLLRRQVDRAPDRFTRDPRRV